MKKRKRSSKKESSPPVQVEEVEDEPPTGGASEEEAEAAEEGNAVSSGSRPNQLADITGDGGKVIVVMERASLETVKTKQGFQLLNCDDHYGLHKKLKRNPIDSRPDIVHQCLLTLLDSPLNKAGRLQIYIKTTGNVLIEVSPHTRIPRTFKRFAGLMVQLLHKMKIRASDGPKTLLKVIKNPVTRHLPPNCPRFGTSVTGTLVDTYDFAAKLPNDRPIIFVFGSMAHGHLEPDYVDEMLSFSDYPLSAACAMGRLLNGLERKWGIL